MAELSHSFLLAKENSSHTRQVRSGSITMNNTTKSDYVTQGTSAESSSKEKIDHDKEDRLSKYLEQMAAKRGQLKAILARPQLALLPIEHIQTTKFAEDDESKLLGNMLEEFFNSAPNTPSTTTVNNHNEPAWKEVRLSQQARESWTDTWKAGKEWKGMPETPTKQGTKKEKEAASTPNLTTTSLDDVRVLMDTIAQPPEKSFDDALKPTLTRALNDKIASEVIFHLTPTGRKPEDATAHAIVPTVVLLDEASTPQISALPSPESELGGIFSRQANTAELALAGPCADALLLYQEAIHYPTRVVASGCAQAEDYADGVDFSAPTNDTQLEANISSADTPCKTDDIFNIPTTPPTTRMQQNATSGADDNPLAGTVFTTRLPTLQEVLESLVNPSRTAAILEACGAIIPQGDQGMVLAPAQVCQFDPKASTMPAIAPIPHSTTAPWAEEFLPTLYSIDAPVATTGAPNDTRADPPPTDIATQSESTIGLMAMNIPSNQSVTELFKEEDHPKSTKIWKWGKDQVAHFKTVAEV